MGKTSFGPATWESIEVIATPSLIEARFNEDLRYMMQVATDHASYKEAFEDYAERLECFIEGADPEQVRENLADIINLSVMFNTFKLGLTDILNAEDPKLTIEEAITRHITTEGALRMLEAFETINRKTVIVGNCLGEGMEILAVPTKNHDICLPDVAVETQRIKTWFSNSGSLRELLKVALDSQEYVCTTESIFDRLRNDLEEVSLAHMVSVERLNKGVLESLKEMAIFDAVSKAAQLVSDGETSSMYEALHHTLTRDQTVDVAKKAAEAFDSRGYIMSLDRIAFHKVLLGSFGIDF